VDCGLRIRNFFMVIGCEAELYLHKLQAKTKRVSELTRSVSERCQSRLTWSRACVPDTCLAHFGRTCTGLDRGVSTPGRAELLVLCGGRDEQLAWSCWCCGR
jgi:ABC-type phosphonate transport system ATPase subunit